MSGVGGGCPCPRGNSECSIEDLNGDTVGNLNQNAAKPPRDHSVMRHCISSSWSAETVSIYIMKLKSYVFVHVDWMSSRFNNGFAFFDGCEKKIWFNSRI